jgi:hypothetical protein
MVKSAKNGFVKKWQTIMAIRSFKDADAEAFFNKGSRPRKKGWNSQPYDVRIMDYH